VLALRTGTDLFDILYKVGRESVASIHRPKWTSFSRNSMRLFSMPPGPTSAPSGCLLQRSTTHCQRSTLSRHQPGSTRRPPLPWRRSPPVQKQNNGPPCQLGRGTTGGDNTSACVESKDLIGSNPLSPALRHHHGRHPPHVLCHCRRIVSLPLWVASAPFSGRDRALMRSRPPDDAASALSEGPDQDGDPVQPERVP
jgi:hypothetical protein